MDAVESNTPSGGRPADPSCYVIVCGLGHVGYRIVRLLIRLGLRGAVIAQTVRKDWQTDIDPRFTVIHGDAREDEHLLAAGIHRATAILAVTDDDLANVSIALDARRLNPAVDVTVRIFDQRLAAQLEKALGVNRALSTSALAVPAFVAAAVGGAVQGAFEADGTAWLLEREEVPPGTALAGTTVAEAGRGLRLPIAIERPGEVVIRPEADVRIEAGDRLTFLAADPGGGEGSPRHRPGGMAGLRSVLAGVGEWWSQTPLALRITFAVMAVLILASVVTFRTAIGLPLIDAVYFVVSTITTVGYGDYNLHDAPPWLKLYGCVLMLCGAVIVAMLVSLVTDLLLQTRLRDVIARGSARAKGHIIVAGLGNIGFRLVQGLLRNGEQVVAIEHREDSEFVQSAREMVPVVVGNVKTEETLRKAGAAGAKALLAVTDDDLANLSITLAAKRTRPDCRVVTRIFDTTLAEKMEKALGLDSVLSVSGAAVPTFVGSIVCPGVVQGVVLRDHLLLIFHRTLRAAASRTVSSSDSLAGSEAVLWVKPAGEAAYRAPNAGQRPGEGDRVIGIWWRRFDGEGGNP